jgi:hypothetical protein
VHTCAAQREILHFLISLLIKKNFEAKPTKNASKNQKMYLENLSKISISHPSKGLYSSFSKKSKIHCIHLNRIALSNSLPLALSKRGYWAVSIFSRSKASRSVGGEPCSGLGREGGGAPATWEDANITEQDCSPAIWKNASKIWNSSLCVVI